VSRIFSDVSIWMTFAVLHHDDDVPEGDLIEQPAHVQQERPSRFRESNE
jgi:hypothetical protein